MDLWNRTPYRIQTLHLIRVLARKHGDVNERYIKSLGIGADVFHISILIDARLLDLLQLLLAHLLQLVRIPNLLIISQLQLHRLHLHRLDLVLLTTHPSLLNLLSLLLMLKRLHIPLRVSAQYAPESNSSPIPSHAAAASSAPASLPMSS